MNRGISTRPVGRAAAAGGWFGLPELALATCVLLSAGVAAAQSGFSLGVAAGDVTDTSAVIWTRADWASVLRYELATDDAFARITRSGLSVASPDRDCTVKITLTGLTPATDYFYRFTVEGDADHVSPTGRFRTAPPPDQPAALRFVFSGDTGYEYRPFPILSAAVQEGPDLLVWFGDTIYADDPRAESGIATTLEQYRQKYRELRSDPYVRAALAAVPVWVGWDDHELRDNYAGADPALSAEQRAAAYRAFFEYMPVQDQALADDPFRTYRRFRWGSLVECFLIDGRQYRDPSAETSCRSHPDPLGTFVGPLLADPACAATLSAERSLLGAEQFEWLTQGLLASTATVKFVINDVPLSYIGPLPYDRWDGYDAERRRLLEFIAAHRIGGVVFLTTDLHSNWYNPDVLWYFRQRRGDYDLSGDVEVIEAIVGPLGVPTLHQTALELAGLALGWPAALLLGGPLTGLEQQAARRLQRVAGFELIELNRVSYLVVDVSAAGDVQFTYRGVPPGRSDDPDLTAATFYTAPRGAAAAAPCCLPLLAVGAMVWPALVARRSAARRGQRQPRGDRLRAGR